MGSGGGAIDISGTVVDRLLLDLMFIDIFSDALDVLALLDDIIELWSSLSLAPVTDCLVSFRLKKPIVRNSGIPVDHRPRLRSLEVAADKTK